jgi:hypothetical protein
MDIESNPRKRSPDNDEIIQKSSIYEKFLMNDPDNFVEYELDHYLETHDFISLDELIKIIKHVEQIKKCVDHDEDEYLAYFWLLNTHLKSREKMEILREKYYVNHDTNYIDVLTKLNKRKNNELNDNVFNNSLIG